MANCTCAGSTSSAVTLRRHQIMLQRRVVESQRCLSTPRMWSLQPNNFRPSRRRERCQILSSLIMANMVWLHKNRVLHSLCPSQRRKAWRKPGARITNSARLFTPGEKYSIADSKVGVIAGWVVISLISKIWMFIRSGKL